MTEYNERILKNVLQDIREEQDAELLKEIEEAKNNPRFQNKEGEAEAFVCEYEKKTKKLVIAISVAFIPFTVEGRKSSIAEIIVNFVNSEFLAFDSNENNRLLLEYKGSFIPSWIPDGYRVESINNEPDIKEIIFSDSDNCIVFKELDIDLKMNIDYTDAENLKELNILGYNAILYTNDGINRVVITTEESIIYISCDNSAFDIIGFAKLIEKR